MNVVEQALTEALASNKRQQEMNNVAYLEAQLSEARANLEKLAAEQAELEAALSELAGGTE